MAEEKIPGLGDVVKTVANLALYQQRVAEGKTSDGVIYLVLAERKVFFNGEDWTEGGVTKAELEEVEEVAAAALNELEDRKADKEYVEDALKNMDTSSLASKEELEALRNEVITNEEIVASSLNELEDRKADKEYVEDAITSAITTTLNTEV